MNIKKEIFSVHTALLVLQTYPGHIEELKVKVALVNYNPAGGLLPKAATVRRVPGVAALDAHFTQAAS